MKAVFERILQSYGTAVIVEREGRQVTCRAFLQPERHASEHQQAVKPLGRQLPGEAVYIGPAEVEIAGATVLLGDERWRVRRWERIRVGDTQIYFWGALTREGEADRFAGA